jgi:hypothetical protein
MSKRTILWIDELAVAYIDDSSKRIVFVVRDDDGGHLTIWLQNDVFRFEFSSAQPVGSVWDQARRGIARDHPDCRYRNWHKHANYIANRTMDYFADSTIPLISLSMPRRIKPAKPSLRSRPAIHLASPALDYDLSLYFSPSREIAIPDSAVFEGQIGRLVMGLTPM